VSLQESIQLLVNQIPSYLSQAQRNMRDSPIGLLQRLPLELRNDIYNYALGDCTSLTISQDVRGFGLHSIRRELPRCLKLNHQIVDEATKAHLHHKIRVVRDIRVPNAEDLLSAIPPNMELANVRCLEFTRPQTRYTNNRRGSLSIPSSAHDLVLRCPRLQELTVPISASIVLDEDYEAYFSAIFEHKGLLKLTVTCNNTPNLSNHYAAAPDWTKFQPFEEWFLREGRSRGRYISLLIDLTGRYKDSRSPECIRRTKGCIKFVEFMDFFG
jgi:hypothetical protein